MVDESLKTKIPRWTLHIDGASSTKGSKAGIILEKEGDILVQLSVKFKFSISNNQAEYKALIARLQLATDISATQLTICSVS